MVEFLLILGALVIYFTPLLVAAWVRHPKLAYIGGVNAALGVTVVGWAGALLWALRRRKVIVRSYHGDMEMPRSFNMNLAAVIALVMGVAVIATVALNRVQLHRTLEAGAPLYAAGAVTAQPQWQYSDAGGVRVASLQSSNSPNAPTTYKGGPVTLGVTRGPGGAIVKIDADAELACSYAPTASSVAVSFDSGPAQTFACAPAPDGARKLLFDGDHSTAYLADPTAFLARLKGVRHISLTLAYSGVTGPQTLEYDMPAESPAIVAQASPTPGAKAADAAAVPAAAVATASATPAVAGADDDQAGADDRGARHHHRHRHHAESRKDEATYVDGIPARSHGRHARHEG